jgi:hypothetical protein
VSFVAEDKAISGRFQSAWDAGAYPAKYDGISFTQPEAAPWVALVLLSDDDPELAELGEFAETRYTGAIVVQIFVPENDGVRKAKEIADLVRPIFNRKQFFTETNGLITTYQTGLRRVGQSGGWIQFNATTLYKREEAVG